MSPILSGCWSRLSTSSTALNMSTPCFGMHSCLSIWLHSPRTIWVTKQTCSLKENKNKNTPMLLASGYNRTSGCSNRKAIQCPVRLGSEYSGAP